MIRELFLLFLLILDAPYNTKRRENHPANIRENKKIALSCIIIAKQAQKSNYTAVNITGPSVVIKIDRSNTAERLPSVVRIVHPSVLA